MDTINVYRWEDSTGCGPRTHFDTPMDDIVISWDKLPTPQKDGYALRASEVCATTRKGHAVWWPKRARMIARKCGFSLVRYTVPRLYVVIGLSGHQCFFSPVRAISRRVLVRGAQA